MTERFFIFGAGYSGLALAAALRRRFGEHAQIYGTSRHAARAELLAKAGITPLLYDGRNFRSAAEEKKAAAALKTARLCFVSIPPARGGGGDGHSANNGGANTGGANNGGGAPEAAVFTPAPALDFAGAHLGAAQSLAYLSTIGVYGDTQGAWVDENAPLKADSPQSGARQTAEAAWRECALARGINPLTLRLGGIYGGNLAPAGFEPPAAQNSHGLSRSPFPRIIAGSARAIIKPGQVFNRMHIEDIAEAACYLALGGKSGVFNLVDGAPSPPQDFLNFAAKLAGKAPCPAIPFAEAEMSPQARAFYRNNRRVSNAKLSESGYRLRYPDYKTGLTKIYQSQNW